MKMISKMKRPLEVDAYTNPILAPIGENPIVQLYYAGVMEWQTGEI